MAWIIMESVILKEQNDVYKDFIILHVLYVYIVYRYSSNLIVMHTYRGTNGNGQRLNGLNRE